MTSYRNQSDEHFRAMMDNMLEGCQIIGRDWRYIYINAAAERHNRRPKEEMLGQRYMDMWPGIETTHVFEVIRGCLEEGYAQNLENEVTYPDGSIGWFNLSIQPVLEGAFILSEDITASKRVEMMLRDSDQRFRMVLKNTPIVVASLDRDLRYTWIYNPRSGYSEQDVLGKTVGMSTDPQESAHILQSLRRVVEEGASVEFETVSKGNGGDTYYQGYAEPQRGPGGEVTGVALVWIDITGRKKAEERLALRHGATAILAESASVHEAAPRLLEHLGRRLGWTIGELWLVNSQRDRIQPAFAWQLPDSGLEEVLVQQEPFSFQRGEGLPGEVWAGGKARWLTEFDFSKGYPRIAALHQAGLCSFFGFPIHLGSDVMGVMLFAGKENQPPDESLLSAAEAISSQIGQFIQRRRAEEALRESEQKFSVTFDRAPVGFSLNSISNGRLVNVNAAWERITGYTRQEAIGRTSIELGTMTTSGTQAKIMEDLQAGRSVRDVEIPFVTKGGASRVISVNADILTLGGEKFLLSSYDDITEHRQAEQALLEVSLQKRAYEYTRSLIEVSLDPLVTISPEGKITDVNEATVKATGITREELIGTDFSRYFTDPQEAERGYKQVFARGFVTDYPLTICHRDGRLMDVLYNASLYKDADGNVQGIFAAARDVTAQKQASQYARTLLESSLDPLVTISPEGKITDVNEATVKATGVPRQELIGTDFSGYFTDPQEAERSYKQVFTRGFVTDYPLTIRHRDGQLMEVLYNASLYKGIHGNVLGVFAAARDVTVLKHAERELEHHRDHLEMLVKERTTELEESNRELARSNENLEQFAYVASHDLQEPLRIMSSYSQLLERRYKGRLDQDADDFIAFIVDAAARMQKLITDLLAYSRAGYSKAQLVRVDCNQLLARLVDGMSPSIQAAGGTVTFSSLPSIMFHEASLTQLFQNLIGNALKFRGEEPPCVHISARQGEGEWVFSVSDNGIGIEPQYNQRIFMIFQRLHARDKYPGTGIGLSICKKIVETMGGRIWVESEDGKGSTFYFTVPVREGGLGDGRSEDTDRQ
jgi:PAS domain S-box-containing protein